MKLLAERKNIIKYLQKMQNEGLTDGTSGNISLFNRELNLIAISPSGLDYQSLIPEDIPVLRTDGTQVDSKRLPSSEFHFHLALYNKRNDINSIVHTHSDYASTIACLGIELPPVHYMIGFSGSKVPLAPYRTFGTKELSKSIIENIDNFNAILLENHGLIALGNTVSRAYACAEAIEYVAKVYVLSKSIGEPKILSDDEMKIVVEKFKSYGQK